jgi:hypothetical protein
MLSSGRLLLFTGFDGEVGKVVFPTYFCDPSVSSSHYDCDYTRDTDDTCAACRRVVCRHCLVFCQDPSCDASVCGAHAEKELGKLMMCSATHAGEDRLCFECKKTGKTAAGGGGDGGSAAEV